MRLQTLLHHLLRLHFPHKHIPNLECKSNPARELNVVLSTSWCCVMDGIAWKLISSSNQKQQPIPTFTDPEQQCRVDSGLHAEPDQHDSSWAAVVRTSDPLHLCLPHGSLLPDPGCSSHHRRVYLSQAFILLERHGIAGAAETCWLKWEKNLPKEHLPPQWCTRSSFLAHQGQFWPARSFLGFCWSLSMEGIHHLLPQGLPRRHRLFCDFFPTPLFSFVPCACMGLKDLLPFMISSL